MYLVEVQPAAGHVRSPDSPDALGALAHVGDSADQPGPNLPEQQHDDPANHVAPLEVL